MLYYIFTTGRCNLNCKYCGGSFSPRVVPWEIKYSLDSLEQFLAEDSDLTIVFYGGEPLLNSNFIKQVMDKIEAERFIIQTNGTLVRNLEPEYWRRFDAILISIDGRKEITDLYRGMGTYRAALSAAKYLKSVGFKGDLIARMTVTEESDIFCEVMHLLSLNIFDHIHWQLNVVWSHPWRDFKSWLESSYFPGISKLVDVWGRGLLKGRVYGMAPFLGILKRKFEGGPNPPCGAGKVAFAILTNGKILACPIAVDVSWAYLGHIESVSPKELPGRVGIGDPCIKCKLLKYCGGRCLYSHKERLWGDWGFRMICRATEFLISRVLGKIERLNIEISSHKDLNYPPYINSIEIIP